ncbi:TPA: fimbrial protein, partial [Escherichia coli]|nr:fimbrial protein [Escherichia coli]
SLSLKGVGAQGLTENSYLVFGWDAIYNSSRKYTYKNQSINNIYYRYDFDKKYYYQLGRMDRSDLSSASSGNFNFNMLPLPDIDGFQIGTTQSYIKNIEKSISSPVTVMLTRFSRVEAFRNEELLGVWYLNSGINDLDTSRLPDGSYDLTLKIFEQDILVREEKVPFNKGGASFGDMQWDVFAQAGNIVNNNDSYIEKQTNKKTGINAGIRTPVTRNLSFLQGGAIIDNDKYYEAGVNWRSGFLDGVLSGNFSFLYGDGARGNYQNISYTDGFNLSFYRNDKSVDNCSHNYSAGWSGCYESYSFSLSVPVSGWTTTLGYNHTNNEAVHKYDYTPEYFFSKKYKGVSKRWQLTSSSSYKWMDYHVIPTIGVYRSDQSRWSEQGGYFSLSFTRVKENSAINAGYSYNYVKHKNATHEAFLDGRITTNTFGYSELGSRINTNKNNTEAGVTGRVKNRFGDLNGSLNVNKSKTSGKMTHSMSANYNSSFAITGDSVYWGGDASGLTKLSGGVVNVRSDDKSKELIKISGSSYGNYILGSNDRSFIPVSALMPSNLTIEEIQSNDKNITVQALSKNDFFILPGNVFPIDVTANVTVSYIGRALDDKGNPLSNAHILDVHGVRLDEDGGFSFETSAQKKSLFLLKDKDIYSCDVKKYDLRSGVLFTGDLICEHSGIERLGKDLVNNPRVKQLLAYK